MNTWLIETQGFSEFGLRLFVILIGLCLGSFLNVVIYRLPLDLSLVRPGSQCPECKKPIPFWANIPLLGYLLIRGKCHYCKSEVSFRYPLVEMLTGILIYASFLRYGSEWIWWVRDLPWMCGLIALTFIDLDHRIIPDEINYGGLILGLLTSFWDQKLGWWQLWVGAAVGFILFYGLAYVYEWRTGQSGLGGGDIKLIAMLGAFLGTEGVITTIFVSSVVGSIVGILTMVVLRRTNKTEGEADTPFLKQTLPFGPFLVLGALYYYFFGDILWSPFTNPI